MFRTTGESLTFPQYVLANSLTSRRPNIYFNITSPTPGTFIIALHYKGRERAILEMDLKIDDLLEKVRLHVVVTRDVLVLISIPSHSKKIISTYWTWSMSS